MPKTVNIHMEGIEENRRKEKTYTDRAGPCSDKSIAWVQSGPHKMAVPLTIS